MTERRLGPAEKPNFGTPSRPRPAASVVLLRDAGEDDGGGLEVLLLRRAEDAAFMPGVWVFPGGAVDPADGGSEAGHRACAVRELAEEAGVELGPDAELVLFSRWITPEVVSTRYDARFYLAAAPPDARPRPDGVETTDAAWFAPRRALDAHREGELPLSFPTVRQLELLRRFERVDEALEAHRDRPVDPILPKLVGSPAAPRVVLPGDPDYPS